MTGQEKGVF